MASSYAPQRFEELDRLIEAAQAAARAAFASHTHCVTKSEEDALWLDTLSQWRIGDEERFLFPDVVCMALDKVVKLERMRRQLGLRCLDAIANRHQQFH